MEMDKGIAELTKEIMDMFPTAQMAMVSITLKRLGLYNLIFNHVAKVKGEMQDKINDLDRQLYIANKKIEDDRLDGEEFNK